MSEAISTPEFADPYTLPLDELDVSNPMLFKANAFWAYFERMRNEDPVHYCRDSPFGPYWSITKFDDIMEVEKNHEVFSSETGGISIFESQENNVASINPIKKIFLTILLCFYLKIKYLN